MEKRKIKLCGEKKVHGLRMGRKNRKRENKRQTLQIRKIFDGWRTRRGKETSRNKYWKRKRLEGMYCGRMEERVSIKSEDSVVALPLSSNTVRRYIKIES